MKKKILALLFFILLLIPISSFAQEENVYVVNINGDINGSTVSYVEDSIKKAEKNNASAIIFEIDTYGGQVVAAEKIKNAIINTNIKTISYVNNKAESAGVLITIASEKVYMSKTSTIGSAETIPKTEKNISFWRSMLRDTAQYRNRNTQIIEAMADSDVVVPNVSERGKLVNLTAQESLDYGVSDGTARNYNDILKLEHLDNAKVEKIDKSFGLKLVSFSSNQIVSTLLLIIGMVAFVIEIFTPTFGIGGSISVISFGLFFLGNIMSGNSNIYSLIIFLLGMILLVIEVIVPGFGLPGISGIIFVIVGIIMSMQSLDMALRSVAIALIVTIIVTSVLIKRGAKSKFAKKITLHEKTSSDKGYLSVDSVDVNVDDKGISLTDMRPVGKVLINEKTYEAFSDGSFIEKEKEIVVVRVENSKIFVRRSE